MNTNIFASGIHHVALIADDFERAIKFYEKLGLTKYALWGEGKGRIQLMGVGNDSFIEIFASGNGEDRPEGRFAHLAICVDDVESAYKAAIAAGAEKRSEPQVVKVNSSPTPMTIQCGFVTGPEGEVIEFFKQIS